jgi:sRNA-binding protein
VGCIVNEVDAEETAAAVFFATIEVDGFREFCSGRLGSSTYANCEWRKVSHVERARFLELTRAGRIDTGTDYVGIWLRDRHWKLLPDFKLQRTGFTVYRDTRQGDAWQRYWRAQGMKEPSWSPRHGHYLEDCRANGRRSTADTSPMEGWMKQDIDAALARLAEAFPQTFVLEKYRPHWPLKVGIAADIPARCPAVERRVLSVALSAYARRVMYLRGLVAGAARVDLDGNPAGEVTARDAEYAASKLAETLASREAKRAAAVETKGAERIGKQVAATAAAAPPAVKVLTLKKRPVLRLPAVRQQCG